MNRKKPTQVSQDNVDIAGQETVPLTSGVLSAAAFHVYLKQYNLDPLSVALAAGVRYLTLWNIQRGNPIRKRDALLVCHGLHKLTGTVYTAPIVTYRDGERNV